MAFLESTCMDKKTPILERHHELLSKAEKAVYKELPGVTLSAHIYLPEMLFPEAHPAPVPGRTAMLFFHSSQWDNGAVSQFAPHCLHFCLRGAVAIAFEYRMSSAFGTGPMEAMADARSAVRWVRMNARGLQVSLARIIGVGGSAGAHALVTAALCNEECFDEPGETNEIECRPDAMILFSPILDTTKRGIGMNRFPSPKLAKLASPLNRIPKKGMPPTIIFHGKSDRVVPVQQSEEFVRIATKKKNQCELHTFEQQGHGFFNFNVNSTLYEATLMMADQFLVRLGGLAPDDSCDPNKSFLK
jgi:acetyl esterase/lipase